MQFDKVRQRNSMSDCETVLTIIMSALSIIGICMIAINFWLDFFKDK